MVAEDGTPAEKDELPLAVPAGEGTTSGVCGADGNETSVTWALTVNNGDAGNPTYTLVISGSGAMADYVHHSESAHSVSDGSCSTDNCDYNRPWSPHIGSITSVLIKDGITNVGNCAFRSMSSVTSVSIGNSVTVIGENAFKDCEALIEIELPDSVTELKGYCFYSCGGLENVKIGTGLITLDQYTTCFGGTSSLKSFEVSSGNPKYSSYGTVLMNKEQTEIIKVPTAISGAFTIPEGVTYVTGFSGCSSLTEITIPKSAVAIGESAFKDCTSLAVVNLPVDGALKYIGNKVDGSVSQGGSAFSGCSALTEIVIPDSVEKLYLNTFANCTSLETATLGTGINELRNNIFIGCTALETIYYNASNITTCGIGFTGATDNCATNKVRLVLGPDVISVPSNLYTQTGSLKTLVSEIDISATELCHFILNNRYSSSTGPADVTLVCGDSMNGQTIAVPTGYTCDTTSKNGVVTSAATNQTTAGIGPAAGIAVLKKTGEATITIVKKAGTVTPSLSGSTEVTYDGQPHALTASSGLDASIFDVPLTVTYAKRISNDDSDVIYGEATTDAPSAVGVYQVKATAGTPYSGEADTTLTIKAIDLSRAVVTPKKSTYAYTGAAITPEVVVILNGETLTQGTDYTVTYSSNISIGTSSITVSGIGNYYGSAIGSFTIAENVPNVTAVDVTTTYDGGKHTINVIADRGTISYYSDPDMQTSITGMTDAGSYAIYYKLSNISEYSGEITGAATLIIKKAVLTITADSKTMYVGDALPPLTCTVSGLIGGDTLIAQPTVACADADINTTGTYSITVSGADAGENYSIEYIDGILTVLAHSSGSSVSSSTRYAVSVEDTNHGTVEANPTRASRGSTVTITVKPNEGYELDKLVVTGKNGGEIKLINEGGGKYTFKMPASRVEIEASFAKIEAEPKLPFADVSSGDWYYDAVVYVYKNGLMDGTGPAAFAPTTVLTRSMAAQVLWNLADSPAVPGTAGFTDVPSDAWYAGAVNWSAARGIVTGYSTGAFGPEDAVTREQLAAMLYRYAGTPEPTGSLDGFNDKDAVSDYAADALCWAVDEGLLTGKGGGWLDPAGTATRAEMAAILMRFTESHN